MHFHFGLVEVFYKETTMNYRKMIVWQKAMNLTEAVYVAIRKLPPAEFMRFRRKYAGRLYLFLLILLKGPAGIRIMIYSIL